MNEAVLKGYIRNIRPSHVINDTEYCKADLIIKNPYSGKDDVILIKFKKFSNRYKENDFAEIYGNVRSYSYQTSSGSNKVEIYIFTYQDIIDSDFQTDNFVRFDGRICKKDILRCTTSGKQNLHLIVANNILSERNNQKVNSYIPCVAWGKQAINLNKLGVNDKIEITGEIHSREYKKKLENNEIEIRVAHEVVIKSFCVVNED